MEERLTSQTNQEVFRVGDTVHRAMGRWSPAVHDLLEYLASVQFTHAPRVLGVDEEGREVLTYFNGVSGRESWKEVVPLAGLRSFAALLRSYHDAVKGYKPRSGLEWALADHAPRSGEIVCHCDFGPWNIVWSGSKPIGIVDWDFASPAPAMYDVAYALEYVAPFRDDETCVKWLAYPKPPDRRKRIEAFAKAYGLTTASGLVDEVVAVQEAAIENVRRLASMGEQPQAAWVANGYLKELADRVTWTKNHRYLLE
jgi:hypothetical protein